MNKLSIDSIYTKAGPWQNRTVRNVIDTDWFRFKGHYNKMPNMYDKSVPEYLKEMGLHLGESRKQASILQRDFRRALRKY